MSACSGTSVCVTHSVCDIKSHTRLGETRINNSIHTNHLLYMSFTKIATTKNVNFAMTTVFTTALRGKRLRR